jgi:dihydrofolate reductase
LRKLFWQMMVSLDGFMSGPNRELDWHVVSGDFVPYVTRMLGTIDAIILGRVTYQLFAEFWPTADAAEAPAMNGLPKLVFSRTLKKVDWKNSRLARGGPAEEIGALKRQPGKDLALFGSSDLASTFLRLGLIDELRLFVNPVVLGQGVPTFKNLKERIAMRLVKIETLSSGVVVLHYQPA